MVEWLLAGLGLYLVSIYLDAAILLPSEDMMDRLKGRDKPVEPSVLAKRARRATENLKENLPIFITLGLLALIVPAADMDQAILGAQIFVLARAAYVVAYLIAVPFLRSAVYMVSLAGLAVMVLGLL